MGFERGPQVALQLWHAENIGGEADEWTVAFGGWANLGHLTAPEDVRAEGPAICAAGALTLAFAGAREPVAMLVNKGAGFTLGAAGRDGGHSHAVAPQGEAVVMRTFAALENNFRRTFMHAGFRREGVEQALLDFVAHVVDAVNASVAPTPASLLSDVIIVR
jgi:hypothetical protein